MRVIQFSQFGDPSQLHLVERPDLKANESTAIVQVIAASVKIGRASCRERVSV